MIKISQLTAGYGAKTIISRLSFVAGPNESPVILVGRNGTGKSTFLKALLGEISHSGIVQFSKSSIGTGWLPQQYHLPIRMPVFDFIMLGAVKNDGLFPQYPSDVNNLVSSALLDLEIEHLRYSFTDSLSGGEWQLVCLAQLMVQQTDVWLLDEPTASLDIYYKSLVFNFLWRKSSQGKTIFLATHDIPFLPTERGSLLKFPNPTGLEAFNESSLQSVLKGLQSK